jgi:hypothetical protein
MTTTPDSPQQLDASYDFVAIVDFLPRADRPTEAISTRLSELLQKNGYLTSVQNCDTKQEFIKALLTLANASKKGMIFPIHLVGHGLPEGLVMPDTDLVLNWSVIAPAFRQFAPSGLRQTILNMSCCSGINGAMITNHLPQDKFFGIIGPGKEIPFRTAYKINAKFYKKMMAGTSVNTILREIRNEFGKDILFGITSHGYQRLHAKRLRGEKLE